jgi:hypothetical protein
VNLVQLRQSLVEQSGHRGLVQDANAGNWSDKTGVLTNGTHYINTAIRWLNRRWALSGTSHRYATNITPGQYEVTVPNVDFVRRIDVMANSAERERLGFLDLETFRNTYRLPLADEPVGKPRFWTWESSDLTSGLIDAGFRTQPVFRTQNPPYPNQFPDAILAALANPGVWHAQNENRWTWSLGRLAWDKPSGQPDIFTIACVYLGRYYEANANILVDATIDTGVYWVALGDSADFTKNPGFSGYLDADGSLSVIATSKWDFILIGVTGGTPSAPQNQLAAKGEITRFEVEVPADAARRIVFGAPADTNYQMNVWADFSDKPLVADTDENFWTIEHPDLVIRAARLQLEIDGHRNVSGATAFQTQVEGELDRMLAEDRFSYISALTPMEACRRG